MEDFNGCSGSNLWKQHEFLLKAMGKFCYLQTPWMKHCVIVPVKSIFLNWKLRCNKDSLKIFVKFHCSYLSRDLNRSHIWSVTAGLIFPQRFYTSQVTVSWQQYWFTWIFFILLFSLKMFFLHSHLRTEILYSVDVWEEKRDFNF